MAEEGPEGSNETVFCLENLKEEDARIVTVQIARLAEELGTLNGECAFSEVGYEAPTKDVIEARRDIMIQQSKFWSVVRQIADFKKGGQDQLENKAR